MSGRINLYVGRSSLPQVGPPQMPIISRGLPSTASAGNDADYATVWSGAAGDDFAINLNSVADASKTTAWCYWINQATRPVFNAAGPWFGVPRNYTLEAHTSTSSTKPTSGWTVLATITANTDAARIHTGLNLAGYGWFRLNVSTINGASGVNFDLDLRNVSAGTGDSFAFFGDSNTMQCYNGRNLVGGAYKTGGGPLETLLETATGRDAPVILNAGTGGWTSDTGLSNVSQVTGLPVKYVQVCFGTNDANNAGFAFTSGSTQAATFKTNIQGILDALLANGQVPLLATVPWGSANTWTAANAATLNGKLTEIKANPTYSQVLTGPDLYALANGEHGLIGTDGLHFTYDPATQYVDANGFTGYERMLRATRDALVAAVYGG